MIGVITNTVMSDPENHLIFKALNELSKDTNCFLFTNIVQSLPCPHKFAIMQQVEALSHKGILISTDIITSQILKNNLMAKKKYYYVWGPEWRNLSNFSPNQLGSIFYNDEVSLIARSVSHHSMLSGLFKEPEHVVYNWNVNEMRKIL